MLLNAKIGIAWKKISEVKFNWRTYEAFFGREERKKNFRRTKEEVSVETTGKEKM